MCTSQTVISREVRRYMADHSLTQAQLAAILHLTQSKISARLHRRSPWTLADLDILFDIGVPINLPDPEGPAS